MVEDMSSQMVPLVHKRDDEGLEQGCQALAMKIGKGRFEKHSGDRINGTEWMMEGEESNSFQLSK